MEKAAGRISISIRCIVAACFKRSSEKSKGRLENKDKSGRVYLFFSNGRLKGLPLRKEGGGVFS